MVRAPCCASMGLKKGPWTADEDRILVDHVTTYGHDNWRALPKQAGLMRCGKSCRLRWTNYLRPDIKRGNFSKEEEEMIVYLHEKLGNRWSAIAARLPGRTDNEIKNVWHTHIKKRLTRDRKEGSKQSGATKEKKVINSRPIADQTDSDLSSSGTDRPTLRRANNKAATITMTSSPEVFGIGHGFWSEDLSTQNYNASTDIAIHDPLNASVSEPLCNADPSKDGDDDDDDMNFWLRISMETGDLLDLPEL